MILFDFSSPSTGAAAVARWHAVGDRVMGGVSSGCFELDPRGFAVFAGEISTAFGGGFASVRTDPRGVALESGSGIELRTRGDRRRYKLHLRCEPRFDTVLYTVGFEPGSARFADLRFPWSAFAPTFRGRAVLDAPPFDPARIFGFGLMTDGREPGPFRLEVERISAYTASPD